MPTLRSEVWLPRPREEVFAFFEDPRNLEAVTPPWLRFHVLPPAPRRMRRGAFVHYALRIRGAPVWWGTLITRHDPPAVFVDRQLWGPYLKWVHTHAFEEDAGGTRVRDEVEYAHAGGRWIERRIVRPDLEEIFRYRRVALLARFGDATPPEGVRPAR
jgi:ligand-binding SRPBCC domain-containing protein